MSEETEMIISTIDLSRGAISQHIYATQLYGAFCSIYAKFSSKTNKNGKTYTITRVQLGLVMYKGLINLGITRAELCSDNNGGAVLRIELQGLPSFNTIALKEVKIIGDHCTVNKTGANLEILRYVKPIHKREVPADPVANQLLDNIFDEEFLYREGTHKPDDRTIRPTVWGESHKNNKLLKPMERGESHIEVMFYPSPRCPRARHEIK